ncbi:MAG: glycosyltransferase family 2 protein [bacterium]
MKKAISIIVPVYNEEDNILLFYEAVQGIMKKIDYTFEIIFVNDGSSDNSGTLIGELSTRDNRIKYIEFSRNFGKEIATSAGLKYAAGDAALMIDADLQHPVDLIPEFIKKWGKGAEVVVGVREKNTNEGFIKKYGSFFFYKIMNAIGDTKIVPRATDFRLLDRIVIDEFNKFTEKNRMTRGLIDWLGFKRDYIYFVAEERTHGKPSYNCLKLTKLAFSTFIAHSLFPLKIAGYLGVIITFSSGMLGLFMFVEKFLLLDPLRMRFSGTAMLATLILFLVGIILCCLGLVALYIANIYGEVVNRPLYVIRRTNINKKEQ